MSFELNERIASGGFDFGSVGGCRVLLKNNAHYPWFVIVPEVDSEHEELTDLDVDEYDALMKLVRGVSLFIRSKFEVEKVNVGCVGIVVRQLHVHVVGRCEGDPAWPGVVWGCSEKVAYDVAEVERIRELYAIEDMKGLFGRKITITD